MSKLAMVVSGVMLALMLPGKATAAACDRTCLYGFLDAYLAAIDARNPAKLPLAKGVRFTENGVEMKFPDGMWNSVDGRGKYDLRFADEKEGQVGIYTVVTENGNPSILALRMKVVDARITEIETIMGRYEEGRDFPSPSPQKLYVRPILNDTVPVEVRTSRAAMIAAANGYFDSLQLNDGTLHTVFDPRCDRIENGVETTNNPERAKTVSAFYALGCEQQFKLGIYKINKRVRERRYPLIDEERGIVVAAGFFDHANTFDHYLLKDGREMKTALKWPNSISLLEAFKIRDGKISRIEAVFTYVPYFMPSPFAATNVDHQTR